MDVNPYESPGKGDSPSANPRLHAKELLGLTLVAIVATYVMLIVAAAFVNSIRPIGGNPNRAPGAVCAVGSLIFALFGPAVVALPMIKQPHARIYFLACLAVAALAWFMTGFGDMLSKAWERGL